MGATKQVVGVVGMVAAAVVAAGCNGGASGGRGQAVAAVGSTVLAGSLVEPRTGHQAVAVDDGNAVLLVGGETLGSPATATAELWRAGRSVPLPGAMTTGRVGHRAVRLPSGEVWILGGRDARGEALRTTELYDPARRAFRRGPDLVAPRDEAALGLGDGEVVVAFGRQEGSIEVWPLDLSAPRVLRPQVPSGRRGARALVHGGGEVYIAGGLDDDDRPAAPLWVDLTSGAAREAAGRRTEQGEVQHVEGGTAVVASLDGVTVGGYVLGGALGREPFRRVQVVRPDDAELTTLPRLALAFARERAAVVPLARGVLVAGGLAGPNVVGDVEVLTTDGPGAAPALTIARFDAEGTALADGTVLISGGRGRDGLPVGVTELIVPAGAAAPDAAALFAQARAEQEAFDRLVAERDAAVADVQRLTAELTTTRAALDAATQRVRDLEAQLALAQAQAATLAAQLDQARLQAAALQAQQAQLQQQLAQEQARAGQLAQQAAQAQQQAAQAQQQAAQAQQQLAAQQQAAAPTTQTQTRLVASTTGMQVGAVTWLGTRPGP
ncbi:MAG: kelch motif-containing protein [Planctomycetes bacterium]|nr:kelch motif-containing protein [Planctomycetota bacterium]